MAVTAAQQGFIYRVTGRLTVIEDDEVRRMVLANSYALVMKEFSSNNTVMMEALVQIHRWCINPPNTDEVQRWLDMCHDGLIDPSKSHLPMASAAWLSQWNKWQPR